MTEAAFSKCDATAQRGFDQKQSFRRVRAQSQDDELRLLGLVRECHPESRCGHLAFSHEKCLKAYRRQVDNPNSLLDRAKPKSADESYVRGVSGIEPDKTHLFLLKLVFFALFFAVMLGWPSQAVALDGNSSEAYSPQQIADYYTYLAFGSEWPVDPSFSGDAIFKRNSVSPVFVVLLPKPSVGIDWAFEQLRAVVEEISLRNSGPPIIALDKEGVRDFVQRNLPLDRNDPKSDWANSLLIYIGSRHELEGPVSAAAAQLPALFDMFAAAEAGNLPFCATASQVDPVQPKNIGTAIAWIETGPEVESCLYEEIMQSFGIAKDFPPGAPSIFSDDEAHRRPTELDWQLWRIHTDPRIVSGMSRDAASAMVLQILEGN
ncbi:MAG: DUF2927 domain-containing protein [Hyphomicrobiaceae bacterium]|nr:DUF2927 domain-containing protein [Hyphomicrobiaceae bacterium]